MRGAKGTIRAHRGPVLARTRTLYGNQGIEAADQVLPTKTSEQPPEGWARITKAAAYRMLDRGVEVRIEKAGETLRLEVSGQAAREFPGTADTLALYRERLQPIPGDDFQEKPTHCRQECEGQTPTKGETTNGLRMLYQCGISDYGSCPVVKSINRARGRAKSRRLDLWKRSRRVHQRRLRVQSAELEQPNHHANMAQVIAQYPDRDRIETELYRDLREQLTPWETVDLQMMLTRPPRAVCPSEKP